MRIDERLLQMLLWTLILQMRWIKKLEVEFPFETSVKDPQREMVERVAAAEGNEGVIGVG